MAPLQDTTLQNPIGLEPSRTPTVNHGHLIVQLDLPIYGVLLVFKVTYYGLTRPFTR